MEFSWHSADFAIKKSKKIENECALLNMRLGSHFVQVKEKNLTLDFGVIQNDTRNRDPNSIIVWVYRRVISFEKVIQSTISFYEVNWR